jgi:hypothetical protein
MWGGGVKNYQKLRDVIYGRSLRDSIRFALFVLPIHFYLKIKLSNETIFFRLILLEIYIYVFYKYREIENRYLNKKKLLL